MQKVPAIHTYLGCFFAPMLLFFTASGIWQTLGLYGRSRILELLSTIHTSRNLKIGSLTSSLLRDFVLIMSASFMVTIILGLIMALKSGRNRKVAVGCLLLGFLFPVVVVLLRLCGNYS
jgi:hypothetical protein